MEIPYNGNVNCKLVAKRFEGVQFWHVEKKTNGYYIVKACTPSVKTSTKDYVLFSRLDKNFNIVLGASPFSWSDIYDSYFDARAKAKEYNELLKRFAFMPYLDIKIIQEHFDDLMRIQNEIHKKLAGYENFLGIDFCNVGANGIQIRGHHKEIKRYTYGLQPTIKYDFSNIDEVIKEFVEMWWEYDTQDQISKKKRFIADGEKYGWD